MKQNTSLYANGREQEIQIAVGSIDQPHENEKASICASTGETIGTALESGNRTGLSLDNLDAILADDSADVSEILSCMRDLIGNLHRRLVALETISTRRSPPVKRMDWTEILCLTELRIEEHGGTIMQRELQRILSIGSRTTMTHLVRQLRNTGRYEIWRKGRNNIIEAIK